jgi:hypothetical protein
VKHRIRNNDVQIMPSADTLFDRDLLVAKIYTRLKKIIKFQKRKTGGIWRSYVLNDIACKIL